MSESLTRRTFLALSAMLPFSLRAFGAGSSIPVGLELYSVRNALKDDLMGTVRTVGQMGYQCVEFYAPYYDWTDQQAKDMKKLLDDLNVRCYSTHNSQSYFTADKLKHARDLNLILGTKYVVMSSSQPKPGMDGWKEVADQLNAAADQLQAGRWQASHRNSGQEYEAVGHAAIRHRHLPGGGLRSRCVDSRQSRPNPIDALQRLGAGKRLRGSIWRRLGGLEKHFRGCRECWRNRVLPDRTGRQQIL